METTDSKATNNRTTLLISVLVAVITLTGLFLRFEAAGNTVVNQPIRGDASDYVAYALNLKIHGVYSKDKASLTPNADKPQPDALRSPGYPLFLSLFTGADNIKAFESQVIYAQALFSTLLIPLIFLLARPLLGTSASLLVSALTAISPHLINANSYLLTESLFAFFILASLLMTSKALQKQQLHLWIGVGLLLGATALVRPTMQYFIPFLWVLILSSSVIRHKGITIVAISVSFLAIYGLWLFRNGTVLGALSDPTLTVNTLHHGMYPYFMYEGRPETFGFPYRYNPSAEQISQSTQTILMAILEYFKSEPLAYLGWILQKPLYLFDWGIIAGQGDIFIYPTEQSPYYGHPVFTTTHQVMQWLHLPIIWLAFIGTVLAWLPQRILKIHDHGVLIARLLSLLYFYFILVHMVGAPFPRYSIPIRTITYLLAVLPIAVLMINMIGHSNNARDSGQ